MKKKSTLDKLFLGVILGGAVGSVVGATMTNKDRREKIKNKMMETSGAVRNIIEEKRKNKKSLWHKLHNFFYQKKK